jgi:hypothetical protein
MAAAAVPIEDAAGEEGEKEADDDAGLTPAGHEAGDGDGNGNNDKQGGETVWGHSAL